MTWMILRVFAGSTLKVADLLDRAGAAVYCPRETIARRHPNDKRVKIDVVKPLVPGYVFVTAPVDVETINRSHIKTRMMTFDRHYLVVSDRDIARLREAEANTTRNFWDPDLNTIIGALHQAVTGSLPGDFVSLGALQTLARGTNCGMPHAGRAA